MGRLIRSDRNPLYVVTDEIASQRRAYVVGLDQIDFATAVTGLEDNGWSVINGDEDRLADEVTLREHLVFLATADDLVIPNTWWSSVTAMQLVQIAGWINVPLISAELGTRIETLSMRGAT
jgi:hypothetical protein